MTPLKLILIRHAKSDWGNPMQRDHDRPLNDRGLRDAPRIGAWLAERGHVPDKVRLSTAERVQQTWAGITSTLPDTAREVTHHPELYHAEPERILSFIRGGNARTLAIIAHNPGIGDTAAAMATRPPDHPRFTAYPTAATTVFEIDESDWRDVGWGAGRVVDFVVPRDLA